ncbi:MAG: hypothetical protein V1678_05065 [Candidatus Aenigmatarchaeota archaeon]
METLLESKEYRDLVEANRQFRYSLMGVDLKPKHTPERKIIVIRKCPRSSNSVKVTISRELHGNLKVMKGRKTFDDYIKDLVKSQKNIVMDAN